MKMSIYQIKNIKDCKYAFRSWTDSVKSEFKFSDYKKVYGSDNDYYDSARTEAVLDNIFAFFNEDGVQQPDYKGHSLSVSDIVLLKGHYYYCCSFGWEDITMFVKF